MAHLPDRGARRDCRGHLWTRHELCRSVALVFVAESHFAFAGPLAIAVMALFTWRAFGQEKSDVMPFFGTVTLFALSYQASPSACFR
jgi:hypothetical protein